MSRTSRTSAPPGTPGQHDSWQGWAPRGIAMLEDLGDEVPHHFQVPQHPDGEPEVPRNFESLEEYLKFKEDYVYVHDKWHSGFRERMALFHSYSDLEETADHEEDELRGTSLPVFMTLRPSGDLRCHRHVLVEDLGVSKDAIISLINLAKCNGPHGVMEANRILFHLMKDKSDSTWRSPDGASGWVKNSVVDANEALRNWTSWEGPNAHPSIRPGRPSRTSWTPSASSSSRSFAPPRTREVR